MSLRAEGPCVVTASMIETGHDRTKIRILKSAVRNVDVHAEDAQD